MEEELNRKLGEYCRNKLIYKMARERYEDSKVARQRGEDSKVARKRDEDSKDVKARPVIKDKNEKLVSDRKDVLQVREDYFKELYKQRKTAN